MRISDWSSDVCSSDLQHPQVTPHPGINGAGIEQVAAILHLQQAIVPILQAVQRKLPSRELSRQCSKLAFQAMKLQFTDRRQQTECQFGEKEASGIALEGQR